MISEDLARAERFWRLRALSETVRTTGYENNSKRLQAARQLRHALSPIWQHDRSEPAVMEALWAIADLNAEQATGTARADQWRAVKDHYRAVTDPQETTSLRGHIRRLRARELVEAVFHKERPAEEVEQLRRIVEDDIDDYGSDAYRTSIDRMTLAAALRDRTDVDSIDEAVDMLDQEFEIRTRRYGEGHPFTLVASAERIVAYIYLGESARVAGDVACRNYWASKVFNDLDNLQEVRDRIFEPTSRVGVRARRHRARAHLLRDEHVEAERLARVAWAYEVAEGDVDTGGLGRTLLALALALEGRRSAGTLESDGISELYAAAHDARDCLLRRRPNDRQALEAVALVARLDGDGN